MMVLLVAVGNATNTNANIRAALAEVGAVMLQLWVLLV
jgi:hypothetical protein